MTTLLMTVLLTVSGRLMASDQAPAMDDLFRLGREAMNEGKYGESEHYFRLAVTKADEAKDLVEGVRARVDLAGLLLFGARDMEAQEVLEKALGALQTSATEHNPQLSLVLINLGAAYRQTGQYKKSESVLNRAKVLFAANRSGGREADLLTNLGALYAVTGRTKLAQSTLREAVTLDEREGNHPIFVARTLTTLAAAYCLDKKWGLAEPLLFRARLLLERSVAPDHPELAAVLSNLGFIYTAQKKFQTAESVLRRSLEIRMRVLGAHNLTVACTEMYLADVLTALGAFDEAARLYEDALKISDTFPDPNDLNVAVTLERFAKLTRLKAQREAAAMERRAALIREERTAVLEVGK